MTYRLIIVLIEGETWEGDVEKFAARSVESQIGFHRNLENLIGKGNTRF